MASVLLLYFLDFMAIKWVCYNEIGSTLNSASSLMYLICSQKRYVVCLEFFCNHDQIDVKSEIWSYTRSLCAGDFIQSKFCMHRVYEMHLMSSCYYWLYIILTTKMVHIPSSPIQRVFHSSHYTIVSSGSHALTD